MSGEARLTRRALTAGAPLALLLAGAAKAQAVAPPPSSSEALAEQRLRTDWPDLARYRRANLEDKALPPEQRRVVFLGDSITQGWFDKHPAFFADNGFIGRGIGGQTTAQMLVRFWPDVISLRPKAVHVLAGTNDIAGNTGPYDPAATRDNLRAMCALARFNGVKVILGAVTPAASYPWRPGLRPDLEIPALNGWIANFAREQCHVYADYGGVLEDGHAGMRAGLAYDQVHPTLEGYAVMEPVTLDAAARAGA